MTFTLRDSLSGASHAVERRRGRPLTLYVCGPTVYDATHVGHGRTYLYFDVIRRLFREERVPVTYVMNITDVEDKISARATALRVPWTQLARREEAAFWADLKGLRVLPPTHRPRASAYVARMVEVARRLERTGRVRRTEAGWVYSPDPSHAPENFPVGAELAEHAVPEPGHPFEVSPGDAQQFLIWKPQSPPLPTFPSPWGPGVPGWHLECYTMAAHLLGLPVDLHGGGMDLVFPHHYAENEVALTLDRHPFSRTYLHTAFVTENGRKMSKSRGNLVPLRTALSQVGPDALRWYLLNPPYSTRLEYRDADLQKAAREWTNLRSGFRASVSAGAGGAIPAARFQAAESGVRTALSDGLRVHDAYGELRSLAVDLGRSPNGRVARGGRPSAMNSLRTIGRRLGLDLV